MSKKWWKSKTMWVNVLTIGGSLIASESGLQLPIEPKVQITILASINMILRLLTNKPLAG